jgi:hypothetical protein
LPHSGLNDFLVIRSRYRSVSCIRR